MKPWQKRLIEERDELDARRIKLINLIVSPKFASITEEDRILLKQQEVLMLKLFEVLCERIARFEVSNEPH